MSVDISNWVPQSLGDTTFGSVFHHDGDIYILLSNVKSCLYVCHRDGEALMGWGSWKIVDGFNNSTQVDVMPCVNSSPPNGNHSFLRFLVNVLHGVE